MSKINFKPWIGKNYNHSGYNGKKILVLGESHYCPKELKEGGRCYPKCRIECMNDVCFNQTKDVVLDYINEYRGDKYQQTFLCFERAVFGKKITEAERKNFWNSIIFYNYIQFAQSGPRKNLRSETFNTSEEAFNEILKKYKPDCIIVWGCRLYSLLPSWDRKDCVLKADNDSTDVNDSTDIFIYNIEGKDIPAMKVYHPSCPKGKSWTYWHRFYKKFFSASSFCDNPSSR